MAVAEQTTPASRDTHTEVRIMQCPNCGHELHFTKRTVQVTCRCGKTYKLQESSYS